MRQAGPPPPLRISPRAPAPPRRPHTDPATVRLRGDTPPAPRPALGARPAPCAPGRPSPRAPPAPARPAAPCGRSPARASRAPSPAGSGGRRGWTRLPGAACARRGPQPRATLLSSEGCEIRSWSRLPLVSVRNLFFIVHFKWATEQHVDYGSIRRTLKKKKKKTRAAEGPGGVSGRVGGSQGSKPQLQGPGSTGPGHSLVNMWQETVLKMFNLARN